MKYTRININTATPAEARSRVMIIYTGGTFGMTYDESGVLIPFDFSLIKEQLPALRNLFLEITVISFAQPVDSSNISPEHWKAMAEIIFENYQDQDGFVVLHGTDTMAFSASALSFMLPGLGQTGNSYRGSVAHQPAALRCARKPDNLFRNSFCKK
jgi:L-asparaginase